VPYGAGRAEAFARNRHPGSFMLIPCQHLGLFELDCFCPSGSGLQGSLLIGEGFKPGGDRLSFRWNGSRTEPTLDPLVEFADHWCGWLRSGYWQVCG